MGCLKGHFLPSWSVGVAPRLRAQSSDTATSLIHILQSSCNISHKLNILPAPQAHENTAKFVKRPRGYIVVFTHGKWLTVWSPDFHELVERKLACLFVPVLCELVENGQHCDKTSGTCRCSQKPSMVYRETTSLSALTTSLSLTPTLHRSTFTSSSTPLTATPATLTQTHPCTLLHHPCHPTR